MIIFWMWNAAKCIQSRCLRFEGILKVERGQKYHKSIFLRFEEFWMWNVAEKLKVTFSDFENSVRGTQPGISPNDTFLYLSKSERITQPKSQKSNLFIFWWKVTWNAAKIQKSFFWDFEKFRSRPWIQPLHPISGSSIVIEARGAGVTTSPLII